LNSEHKLFEDWPDRWNLRNIKPSILEQILSPFKLVAFQTRPFNLSWHESAVRLQRI